MTTNETPLVERLRALADKNNGASIGDLWNGLDEAADEIERLQSELAQAQRANQELMAQLIDKEQTSAVIVEIVFRFIDRMNDVCEQDPADRILREFVEAMEPAINRAIAEQDQTQSRLDAAGK